MKATLFAPLALATSASLANAASDPAVKVVPDHPGVWARRPTIMSTHPRTCRLPPGP
jgi:hypothetical protein